jgi:hypothetical protein
MKKKRDENRLVLVSFIVILILCLSGLALFLNQKPGIMGYVVQSMSLRIGNTAPIINLSDIIAYTGDLVNISNCAYDMEGDPVNCSFSYPINSSGLWQTNLSDEGIYNIEINATDGKVYSTKNISLTVIGIRCTFTAERNIDNTTVNLEWSFPFKSYTNYTLYWIDSYIQNGTIKTGEAFNKSLYNQTQYNDTNASSVIQRYYQIRGHNSITEEMCNKTVGKYTFNLISNFGRWNYVSIPVYQNETGIEQVLSPGVPDLDFAFWYNISKGGFEIWSFTFHLGKLKNIYPGESYIIQPLNGETNITVVGPIVYIVLQNLSIINGRWNYLGWVAELTPRSEAEIPILTSYDWLYWYNKTKGGFEVYSNDFKLGKVNELKSGEGYLIQPTSNVSWYYDMYNNS